MSNKFFKRTPQNNKVILEIQGQLTIGMQVFHNLKN